MEPRISGEKYPHLPKYHEHKQTHDEVPNQNPKSGFCVLSTKKKKKKKKKTNKKKFKIKNKTQKLTKKNTFLLTKKKTKIFFFF